MECVIVLTSPTTKLHLGCKRCSVLKDIEIKLQQWPWNLRAPIPAYPVVSAVIEAFTVFFSGISQVVENRLEVFFDLLLVLLLSNGGIHPTNDLQANVGFGLHHDLDQISHQLHRIGRSLVLMPNFCVAMFVVSTCLLVRHLKMAMIVVAST